MIGPEGRLFIDGMYPLWREIRHGHRRLEGLVVALGRHPDRCDRWALCLHLRTFISFFVRTDFGSPFEQLTDEARRRASDQ